MKRSLSILLALLWVSPLGAADRIRIGYSSISGGYIPLWVAHDGGYFSKEGLQDDIVLIPSGTQLAQVTVAGEIDVGLLNGSSAARSLAYPGLLGGPIFGPMGLRRALTGLRGSAAILFPTGFIRPAQESIRSPV